ncbi:helicase C-terminal domain-containing protein [Chytriomyces sp. MP71]|nr:helicase C-terminal domain-containing protein [Chytriomyces sp. MP71]
MLAKSDSEPSTVASLGQAKVRQFPFPYGNNPWQIQHAFMSSLYECIESGNVGVFESPTGTGKSLSLICGSLKWLTDANSLSFEARIQALVSAKVSALTFDLNDESEPKWVREATLARIEREAKAAVRDDDERRLRRDQRIAKMRSEEDRRAERRAWGQGQPSRKIVVSKAEEENEADFLVDDYDSEDGESPLKANRKLLKKLASTSSFSDDELDEGNSQEDEEEDLQEIKIFYCSRTHSQLSQFIHELNKTEYSETVKSVSLGSRKNLCINDAVMKLSSVARMNDACLDLQKGKGATTKCPYLPTEKKPFRDFSDAVHATVRDIEELSLFGKQRRVCSYYGTRASVPGAQIVTLPYNMMLQKSTRESLGIKLKGNIVIFDEAHNLIDTITSIYSVTLEMHQLRRAQAQLQAYFSKYVGRLKGKNVIYIKQTLILLTALLGQLAKLDLKTDDKGSFASCSDFLSELNVDHINLFKICAYLEASKLALKVQGFHEKKDSDVGTVGTEGELHVPALQQFQVFIQSLLNTSLQGRIGVLSGEGEATRCFKYLLLSPTDVFKEIVDEARSVVLAGGTMEPMAEFKSQLLDFVPTEKVVFFSCGHIVPPTSILTVSVPMGASGNPLTFTYGTRTNDGMITDLGNSIAALCGVIPHGVVCFFVSYAYMDHVAARWKATGILARIERKKKVFFEPRQARAVEECLGLYVETIAEPNKGCADGKRTGSILFCVVGGKMSEGINFSDNMARAVIMVSLPYPSKNSPELVEKMRYIDSEVKVEFKLPCSNSSEYYENLCMRALNQSIGRAIRHKDDYAAIYLIDKRFSNKKVRDKLPGWIQGAGVQDVGSFGEVIAKTGQV